MNSPKPNTSKIPRFASNHEVFNYTVDNTTNQDDSLLLTPQREEALRMRSSIGPK